MHKFKMELPDAVLAFKLLDTAGLNVKDRQFGTYNLSKPLVCEHEINLEENLW